MSVVQDAAEAEPVARLRRTFPAFAAVALLAAGCGSSGGGAPKDAEALSTPIRLARCVDWRRSPPSARRKAVRQLRAFSGGPVGEGTLHGATLDDRVAYRVLNDYCSNGFAAQFKLYKLYTRAASFRRPPGTAEP